MMHIYDREWCNLFLDTVNGASLFHIQRDRQYWALAFCVLAEFWWGSVVPAKHALAKFEADPRHSPFLRNANENELKAAKLEVVWPFRWVPPPSPQAISVCVPH